MSKKSYHNITPSTPNPNVNFIEDNSITEIEHEYTISSMPTTFAAFKQTFQKKEKGKDASRYIFFFKHNSRTLCFFDDISYQLHVKENLQNSSLSLTYKLKTDLIPQVQLKSNKVANMSFEDLDKIKAKQAELIEEYTKDIIAHQEKSKKFLQDQRSFFVAQRNEIVEQNSHLANYFERTLYKKLKQQLGVSLNIPKETPIEGKESTHCSYCREDRKNRLYQCSVCEEYYLCERCINIIKDMHDHEFFILRNKIEVQQEAKVEELKNYNSEVVNKQELLKKQYKLNSNKFPDVTVILKNTGILEWTGNKVLIEYMEGDLKQHGAITLSSSVKKNDNYTMKINLKNFEAKLNEGQGKKFLRMQCKAEKKYFGEVIEICVTII